MTRWLTSALLNACVVFGLTLGLGVVAYIGLFFSQFEPTSTPLQNQVAAFGLLAASIALGAVVLRLRKQHKTVAPDPSGPWIVPWAQFAVLFGMYCFMVLFAFATVFQALQPKGPATIPVSIIAETGLILLWLILTRTHEHFVVSKHPSVG